MSLGAFEEVDRQSQLKFPKSISVLSDKFCKMSRRKVVASVKADSGWKQPTTAVILMQELYNHVEWVSIEHLSRASS